MKPQQLLELAATVANRRPSHARAYQLAAFAERRDGLLVSAFNVQVPTQRPPRGHAEYRIHSKLTVGSVVAVARLSSTGEWALAKPCKACEALLRNCRVKKVFYTIGPREYGALEL